MARGPGTAAGGRGGAGSAAAAPRPSSRRGPLRPTAAGTWPARAHIPRAGVRVWGWDPHPCGDTKPGPGPHQAEDAHPHPFPCRPAVLEAKCHRKGTRLESGNRARLWSRAMGSAALAAAGRRSLRQGGADGSGSSLRSRSPLRDGNMRVAPHSSTQHVVPPKTSWLCLGPGECPPAPRRGSASSGEDEEQLVAVCTLTARDRARSVPEQLSLPLALLLALPRSAAPLLCAMVQTPAAVQGARCCPKGS